MAIHPDFPGLKVEIVVQKKALQEHDDLDVCVDPMTTTRYLEAPSGAAFGMQYTFLEYFPVDRAVSMSMFVDGMRMQVLTSRAEKLRAVTTRLAHEHKTVLDGVWGAQKMHFSDLNTTDRVDAEVYQHHLANLGSMGEIKVVFAFCEVLDHSKRVSKPHDFGVLERLPETILKGSAKSLRLRLGHKRIITRPSKLHMVNKKTFAVFIFKYRSSADLEALGIVPRTLAPAPGPPHGTTPTLALANHTVNEPEIDSSPLEESNAPAPTLMLQEQGPAPTQHDYAEGLDVEEIIVMIAVYRGRDDGLAGQSKKSLLGLLKHYEDRDKIGSTVETKSSPAANVKRERDESHSLTSKGKRSKQETIVLDD